MASWIPLYPHPLEGEVRCNCNLPAKLLTTRKQNANFNRQFFICFRGSQDPDKCSYWKWADELMGETSQPDSSQSTMKSSPPSSQGNLEAAQHLVALTSATTGPTTVPSTPIANRVMQGRSGGLPTPSASTPRRPRTATQEARRLSLLDHALAAAPPVANNLPTAAGTADRAVQANAPAPPTPVEIAAELPPWPTIRRSVTPARRGGLSSSQAGSDTASQWSVSSQKRRRVVDNDDDDNPFLVAGPSGSRSSGGRLFGNSGGGRAIAERTETTDLYLQVLEARIAELERTREMQANLIEQQAALITRSEQSIQAVENANQLLLARMDRLERHVAETESDVERHEQALFDSDIIDNSGHRF